MILINLEQELNSFIKRAKIMNFIQISILVGRILKLSQKTSGREREQNRESKIERNNKWGWFIEYHAEFSIILFIRLLDSVPANHIPSWFLIIFFFFFICEERVSDREIIQPKYKIKRIKSLYANK